MSSTHPYPRRWQALAVIATAQFLVIMDTSIIGVALPDMQQSLGFSPSDLSWVFNAGYAAAFTGAAAIALVAAALAATTIGRRSTSESERESTGEPALVG